MRMLANVQQRTIQPIIEAAVARGARIHTDEYDIYAHLPAWGFRYATVCHARGECARDEETELAAYSAGDLVDVAAALNAKPRKTLN